MQFWREKSASSRLNVTGWKKNLMNSSSHKERLELVEPTPNRDLSIQRQCELLHVNRSSLYRKKGAKSEEGQDLSHGESPENLDLMRRLDELHMEHPAWGYRRLTAYLRHHEQLPVNWKRVRRLMHKLGIETLYPKPNLSKLYHAEYVRPYLLKNLDINHVDHVWGIDITYLPLQKGFMYLFIIIDWYSRFIVDYEISFTLEKEPVLLCLRRALATRQPEIINSDQGSQFTNEDYLELMKERGVKVSMDSKGRAYDNIRTERFFRSLKYEDVYIKAYEGVQSLRQGVHDYIDNYCHHRPHQSLDYKTPAEVYYDRKHPVVTQGDSGEGNETCLE